MLCVASRSNKSLRVEYSNPWSCEHWTLLCISSTLTNAP